ncbi:LytTR family DNA-binding domain-containing protein [Rheinheimera sp. MMS21-TC3]|uniref:LytR/AlgR family response regulator transcription factor n=1 Tax=Rheinheimera sp. MMS21-TC3 TaxID=3072790 RepID=UPI0028C4FD5E|nr:LytTR family DNA-binding domain-containing protein [Rheinheimera sp. MMS21-TC3]WNO61534.1 LytTR family DNA-binding domain-containing protein [Rheinheimera sp. MMS21-TC3]
MKVVLIDDSRLARVELKNQLQLCEGINIVGEAENVKQAINVIVTSQPDLLLLDIDMPGGNGFSLLEQLDAVGKLPHVIFVTAFDQYALKSFDYQPKDYLLKPVTLERLKLALAKVPDIGLQAKMTLHSQVFLKDGERCYFVTLSDIFAFEAQGNYTKVHFKGGRPMIYRTLAGLEQKLPAEIFFRANRSWIINTQYISAIEPTISGGFEVNLQKDLQVEISRRQATEFKQLWSL